MGYNLLFKGTESLEICSHEMWRARPPRLRRIRTFAARCSGRSSLSMCQKAYSLFPGGCDDVLLSRVCVLMLYVFGKVSPLGGESVSLLSPGFQTTRDLIKRYQKPV